MEFRELFGGLLTNGINFEVLMECVVGHVSGFWCNKTECYWLECSHGPDLWDCGTTDFWKLAYYNLCPNQ